MFAFLSKWFGTARLHRPAPDVVSFDAERVVRRLADGREESVRWSELTEVHIVTSDAGPYSDDVFWVLRGEQGGCLVPSEAQGTSQLLERLQELPNFDNMAVVMAMGSTTNASFVVWSKRAGPPASNTSKRADGD